MDGSSEECRQRLWFRVDGSSGESRQQLLLRVDVSLGEIRQRLFSANPTGEDTLRLFKYVEHYS